MADGNRKDSAVIARPQLLERLNLGWRRRLPIALQTEAAECGLACLAMVGGYYGHDVDLPSLRQHFSISINGTSLARVIEMAGRLDLDARPLRLDLDGLGQLRTPCVLHWDMNHFVVLKRATSRFVEIHDPSQGLRRLSLNEVSSHFTGVALELWPKADFQPLKERSAISLSALTGKTHGLARTLTQILMMALVLEVLTLVGPFYMQWLLDQALVSADHSLLTMLGFGFLLITIFRVAVTAARSWAVACLGVMLNVQWVNNVVGHLLRLPLSWFEKRHIGDVMSRFSSLHTIQQTMTTQFVGSLLDGLMSVTTLIVMGFYSVTLTALVVALFVLYGVVRWLFFRPLRRAQEDQIIYSARQQSELLETVRGILPIKLANKGRERQARYANRLVDTTNHGFSIQRLNILFTAINHMIFGVGRIILIWMGASLALKGAFTAGMLVAFMAYADQFETRAAELIDKMVDFGMLRLHGERLADIALHRPEDGSSSTCAGPLKNSNIEVRNLSFRYAEGEPWVLRNCSFEITSGESVAIVGPSGSGKTTLAKILLGLLEPTEGEILFGGVSIHELGVDAYRKMLGAVMQDDQVFAGSLADNIAFFDSEVDQCRVEESARLAAVHDDIVAMPMGYQTLVGDMGSSLSGGQKQRLILARALYRRPKVLVLDEATSHLDIERERLVNAAVGALSVTRIIVAHRPETIAGAGRSISLMQAQGECCT